eukprot:1090563-Rhodomonas_salina.5
MQCPVLTYAYICPFVYYETVGCYRAMLRCMRFRVLRYTRLLRLCYAMSGTEPGYAATGTNASCHTGTKLCYAAARTKAGYTTTGTNVRCAATGTKTRYTATRSYGRWYA